MKVKNAKAENQFDSVRVLVLVYSVYGVDAEPCTFHFDWRPVVTRRHWSSVICPKQSAQAETASEQCEAVR